jgi:alpha-tubulin suppressor-like RCC1 family protein
MQSGNQISVILTETNEIYAWGSYMILKCFNGMTPIKIFDNDFLKNKIVKQIAAGFDFISVLYEGNEIYSIGKNGVGQFGDGLGYGTNFDTCVPSLA